MRIAVAAETNNGLESQASHHFGRCAYYVFVDVENNEIKSVSTMANPFLSSHGPGQVPAFIKEQRAEVMLSGGMGRRAVEFFEQMGIQAVTGAQGTVRQSVSRLLNGELTGAEPCADSQRHHNGGGHHHHH